MKRLFIILSLFITCSIYPQSSLFQIEIIYHGDNYREMKRLQKRFDKAVIYKDFFYYNGWYMELESDDQDEYYKRFGIKFYCIPKHKHRNIELLMIFYEKTIFDKNNTF